MSLLRSDVSWFSRSAKVLSVGVTAGFVGGFAEILWIALYQKLSGGEAALVALGVTQTLFPDFTGYGGAVLTGVAIHMAIALVLGVAILILVRATLPKEAPALLEPLLVVGLLVLVWAVNFLVILPIINPAFVTLVPFAASLVSKVLFGVGAALTFVLFGRQLESR